MLAPYALLKVRDVIFSVCRAARGVHKLRVPVVLPDDKLLRAGGVGDRDLFAGACVGGPARRELVKIILVSYPNGREDVDLFVDGG